MIITILRDLMRHVKPGLGFLCGKRMTVALMLMPLLALADAAISEVEVFSGWPWKEVVIGYTIAGSADETMSLELTAKDNASGKTYACKTLEGVDLTPGSHIIKWNASADGAKFKSDDVVFTARIVHKTTPPLYCVVDLSAGENATSYPVSYLDDVPVGGWTDEYKTTKLVLRRIEAGTFTMGSPSNEVGHEENEALHSVELTKPFYMGIFEVTQKQYQLVMGDNPSAYEGDARPVENISFDMIRGTLEGKKWPLTNAVDATSFMGKIRARTGLTFDLPTEAQWEYACRAGTPTALNIGKVLVNPKTQDPGMDGVGRYGFNNGFKGGTKDGKGGYDDYHTTVGSYLPNAWGLYDMHGNVQEWCLDWYESSLGTSIVTDPKGPANQLGSRVLRGGSWSSYAQACRSAFRMMYYASSFSNDFSGLRLCCSVDQEKNMVAEPFDTNGGTETMSSMSVAVDTTFKDWTAFADSFTVTYGSVGAADCRITANGTAIVNSTANGAMDWLPSAGGEYKLVYSCGGVTMESTVIAEELTASAITLTALQCSQRDGLVYITVTLQGAAEDVANAECLFAATNGTTKEAIPVKHITRNGADTYVNGGWIRRFVWDARADVGAVKIDDVALTVGVRAALPGVRLWKNGPYWAECNVGATQPEESGYYFWWGDTVGYKRNADNNGWMSVEDSSSFSFREENCPTYGKGDSELMTAGYIDATRNLVAAHDAATAHLGAPWRMPTPAELSALVNNCETTWTTFNGVYGLLVTGKGSYASSSIFLPAAGYGYNANLIGSSSCGYYASLLPANLNFASIFVLTSSRFSLNSSVNRYFGQSVRPVRMFDGVDMLPGAMTTHLSLDCGSLTVTAQQRYPWNGLVDITVTLQGAAEDVANAECLFAATNGATGAAIPVKHITRNGADTYVDGTCIRRFVWDARADVGAVKIDDVALTVGAKPSGVQLWKDGPYWAECNVGATQPEESGYYFWWGDTVGYRRNADNNGWISVKDSSSFSFRKEDCPTYCKSDSELQLAGYIDSTGNLVAAHDAATTHLGAPWRMPKAEEFSALVSNCKTTWMTRNGVYGRLVTGKDGYASNSIFIPAAGYGPYARLNDFGAYGYCWSASSNSSYSNLAGRIYFRSDYFLYSNSERYWGMTVRPVRESTGGSGTAFIAETAHLSLDCRGAKVADGAHPLVYDYDVAWYAGGVTAKVTANGKEIATGSAGSGAWTPSSDGVHLVTLNVYNALGEVVGTESVFCLSRDDVTELVIPEGITEIPDYALAGGQFISVTIPDSVTRVAPTAFVGCSNLKTITLRCKGVDLSGVPDGCEIVHDIDYRVVFDLGGHGARTGGGELEQTVHHGSAAVAPEMETESGWEFVRWDNDFSCVTSDMTVNAVWVFPRKVRDVTAQQRYPWNGLVDITVTLQDAAEDIANAECLFAATNGTTGAAISVKHITRNGTDTYVDGTCIRRFVWDARADVGAVKIDDVALTVGAKPSGVQLWKDGPYWAECNVGATQPEESGYYFWWGDTVGYRRNADNNGWMSVKDSSSFSFREENCPTYGKSDSELVAAGYIDSTGNLVAAHDAATTYLGAPWRMPTTEELSALVRNCETTWIARNGVYGRLVTGKGSYASNSIFLPASGYGYNANINGFGSSGYYCFSSPNSTYTDKTGNLLFFSDRFNRSNVNRYYGQSVRPVRMFDEVDVLFGAMTTHLSLDCRSLVVPTVEGDPGATVTGDAETGFVVKPSEGTAAVEVSIPQGVDAAKVTVEVSPKVASVKPNGAKVKIVSGGADITEFLNVPAADGNGIVDLTKATVKEEIVKEAMDVKKGALIDLSSGPLGTTGPTITTAPTRVGLFYRFREGETLGGMKDGDSIVGDGEPWTPNITVKGGNSAFYSIGVGKGK